jgi:hypothetical protein
MREIKANANGRRRQPPFATKKTTPRYDPADEATAEDLQAVQRTAKQPTQRSPTPEEVGRIEIRHPSAQLRAMSPGSVWKQGAFKWDPLAFVAESEKLEDRIIEEKVQRNSLAMFSADPTLPLIYGVTGNPDDSKAKFFAAYLAHLHMTCLGPVKGNVLWHTLYGGFDNKILKEYDEIDGKTAPTMLVLSNLTPNSTGVKLEKARDLLERFADIPRVIVAAGEDPMSFLTTRLYVPVNGVAYFSESLVKKRVEVL